MAEKKKYFDFVAAQRYFHLIAYKIENHFSIEDYWKWCGFEMQKEKSSVYDTPKYKIEHFRVITDTQYHNGGDFSVNKSEKKEDQNQPPYNYDLFSVYLKNQNFLIFGFPFKRIGHDILIRLKNNYSLLKKGAFLKCDLNKLLKESKEYISKDKFFSVYFSGMLLTLLDDEKISSVTLDGDKPLESLLYQDFFEKRVQENDCLLDKCSVRCETLSDLPLVKSSIHMDIEGNYKLYIHGTGNNIFTIPYLFEALDDLGSLDTTITIPLIKLSDE